MCLTVDDVLNFGCNTQDICCPYEKIEASLESAVDLVECITGHSLCPEKRCVRYDGTGCSRLYLPPAIIAPVVEVTSVKIDNCSSCACGMQELCGYAVHEHWIEFPCGGHFPCGKHNIEVCGKFGFSKIPAGLKRAVSILALEYAQPGSTGLANPYGVTRVDFEDDMSISYRVDETFNSFGRTSGIKEVDNILGNYLNMAGMLTFVNTCCQKPCCNSKKGC